MHLLHFTFTLCCLSFAAAWKTYTVPHSEGHDDTLTLTAAFSADPSLAINTTILFQQGVTYNILTPIKFPYLQNVTVSIQGNITYAADIEATQAIVGSENFPGHWFAFCGGYNVKLLGSKNPNWGWVFSHGQKWWNAMQEISSHKYRPPGWGFLGITNGEIGYMKILEPIAWSFSIGNCNHVHIHNNTVIAVASNGVTPYNTDAFDVQGSNLLFEYNVVHNDDDCIAIISPSNNIIFRNGHCYGGAGLSIGGLGRNGSVADVRNILFENVVLENSFYAATFKSFPGGKGAARNVTWKDIRFKNARLPIYLSQTYWDQDDGPRPNSTHQSSTHIDNFTFQNFQGTIDDSMGNGATGSTGKEAVIFDVFKGTTTGILAKNISTQILSGSPVTVMCDPGIVSNVVGFKCQNGLFEPTAAGK